MRTITTILALFITIAYAAPIAASNGDWLKLTNGNHVTDIAADGDVLWVATKGGLVKWDRVLNEKTFYNTLNSGLPSDKVEAIAVNGDGSIWIGTYDQGIVLYDGSDWTAYNSDNSDIPQGSIYDIELDENGDLWFGVSLELVKFDGQDFSTFTIPAYAFANTITVRSSTDIEFAWDVDHSSGVDQLFRFDGSTITADNSLGRSGIYRLYKDSQGRTWACYNGGIARRNGSSWVYYDSTSIPHLKGQVLSMTEHNNKFYVGTEKGLYTFDGQYWGVALGALPDVNYLLSDDDKLYIGTLENGLIEREGNRNYNVEVSSSQVPVNMFSDVINTKDGSVLLTAQGFDGVVRFKDNVWSTIPGLETVDGNTQMQAMADGSVWLYSDKVLYHYDQGQVDSWNLDNTGMPTNIHIMVVSDQGKVYLGTYSNGLVTFDGSNWVHMNRINSGLSSNAVRGLAVIDDKVFIATQKESQSQIYYEGGLEILYQNNFTKLDTGNSDLGSYYLQDLLVQGDSLWIAGNNGLDLYYNGVVSNYLAGNDFREMYGAPNGSIWLHGYNNSAEPYLMEWNGQVLNNFNPSNTPIDDNYPYIKGLAFDATGNMWWINNQGTFLYKNGGVSFYEEPTVGINDITVTELKWNIYPNPATANVTVEGEEGATIKVYSLSGAEVMREELVNTSVKLDVSELQPGLYIYQINGKENTEQGKLLVR